MILKCIFNSDETDPLRALYFCQAMAARDAVYTTTVGYCLNGEHEMHLDEKIGYICKRCSYVETEI